MVAEVKVPQAHVLGAEAEVDFGDCWFDLDGQRTKGQMFVMRLPVSTKPFYRVYRNEAQQAFLDGHVRAFEAFGGVPARIRYDNLKPAVVKSSRAATAKRPKRSSYCDRITGSTRSSANPALRMRKAAWKVRSAGSAATISS